MPCPSHHSNKHVYPPTLPSCSQGRAAPGTTLGVELCIRGRGRSSPCCSAVAAQSFLRVPRLPPAPFKTSDPPLQLPSTAGCGPCCCGRGRCAPCCYGRTAAVLWPPNLFFGFRDCPLPPSKPPTLRCSFLPLLAVALDPPLQLPSTAALAAVAVAAAVPAAVLWPPNLFFGFRDCRLPPSKPPTLRCSFLPLLAVASNPPLQLPSTAALAAVAVAAAVPCYGRTAAVLWPPNPFFGFRDCRLPPSKPPTLRCSFLSLLAVSFGAVALSSGSETAISLFQNTAATAGPCCCGRGRCGPCCSAVAAQSFLRVPSLPPAPFKTSDPPLQQLPSTAGCGPCCCGRGRCAPCCYGRIAAVLWPPNLFFGFRDCPLPPSKPPTLRCSFLPLLAVALDPPLQLPSTAALAAVAVAAAVPAAVLWPPNLFFGFRDCRLPPSKPPTLRCSFLPLLAVASNPPLQLPSTAALAAVAVAAAVPCYGRTAAVLWPPNPFFGFRDCRLPPSKPPTLRCSFLSLLAVSFGAVALSSGSETAISLFQNTAATAGPCCCGRGRCGPLLWPHCAVLWPPNLFFGFRDCRLPPSKPPTLLPLLARGRCAPCCSAVAAQSFLRVPRLPPAPFKTSDPPLRSFGWLWPSGSETAISLFQNTAAVAVAAAVPAAVLWPPNRFFGFRDCRLPLQNLRPSAAASTASCSLAATAAAPVAVAAAVPAAVLWPPNRFFGFRDCRLPPSKPPTLRCSFLSTAVLWLYLGFRDCQLSLFQNTAATAALAAVAVAAAGPLLLAVSFAVAVPTLLLWPWPLRSLLPPAPFKTSDPPLHLSLWLWPMLLWPWPLRSLLQCCGRPIVSSGSETAACPLQNLRPSAAASFHCCWLWPSDPSAASLQTAALLAPAAVAVAAAVPAAVLWPPNLFFGFRDCRLPPSKPPTLRCSFLPLLAVSFGAVALSSGSETAISLFHCWPLLLWPWPLRSLLQCCGRPISGSETAACPLQNLRPSAAASFQSDPPLQLPSTAALLLWPWPLRSPAGPCCSAVAAQSFLRVPRLPPAPLKTSDPPLQLPSTAGCGLLVLWLLRAETVPHGRTAPVAAFQNLLPLLAALLWPWPLRSLPSAVAAQSFLRVPRLPPAPFKTSDPPLQLPFTAGCGRCCCGRGRCGPCCSAVAAQSFLRVPRLPPAPFKTSDPPLQLPFTAGCGPPTLRCSFPPLLPLLLWPWPLRSLLQCCGRPIFFSGSETAACPPQNLRPSAAASFHC